MILLGFCDSPTWICDHLFEQCVIYHHLLSSRRAFRIELRVSRKNPSSFSNRTLSRFLTCMPCFYVLTVSILWHFHCYRLVLVTSISKEMRKYKKKTIADCSSNCRSSLAKLFPVESELFLRGYRGLHGTSVTQLNDLTKSNTKLIDCGRASYGFC